ncbi:hypothetical protein CONLIGDRAFT_502615 [Coniochaeta ligniaria NRRL 30616]|uniref:Zn(2)-C6 fungal-type domain-containing protein n=1 Tax=Coniochaeta ligniaria NRRL 30616 TaxID=1408157 RepID=A0A1J7IDY7_9PEZI|nr:hypothetical protein CONLIGDRAFT_502615 [Coniochaeta ligniaria NRRL 30616]
MCAFVPMFKSCNYCRHRKKKCVLTYPSASRCGECEHLELVCEFSLRQPSLKRRTTSQRIASKLSAAAAVGNTRAAAGDRGHWPNPTSFVATVEDGDCQPSSAGGSRSLARKIILRDGAPDNPESTAGKYWRYVHPLTPFVPREMVLDGDDDWDPVLQQCIELASGIWLHHRPEPALSQRAVDSLALAIRGEMSLPDLAGVLLLLLRLPLETDLAQRVFGTVNAALLAGELLPAPVLAGAVVANTWLRLVGSSLAPLEAPEDCLPAYAQTLDPGTFAHHYLRISNLALSYDRLRVALEHNGPGPGVKLSWCRLEYECLFWAVQLPSSLLDLRDEMPARPEAVVIHSLHNLVLLSFYATVLKWQDTLGKLLALAPVPGVLHYICALARSVLICPREMANQWALLSDIQAATARILLDLWRLTRFENFRGMLNLWDDALNRFPDLTRCVREEIGPGPWTIEQTDGYSVFWTFRDLRSLHLEDAMADLTPTFASRPSPSRTHATSTSTSTDTSPSAGASEWE